MQKNRSRLTLTAALLAGISLALFNPQPDGDILYDAADHIKDIAKQLAQATRERDAADARVKILEAEQAAMRADRDRLAGKAQEPSTSALEKPLSSSRISRSLNPEPPVAPRKETVLTSLTTPPKGYYPDADNPNLWWGPATIADGLHLQLAWTAGAGLALEVECGETLGAEEVQRLVEALTAVRDTMVKT